MANNEDTLGAATSASRHSNQIRATTVGEAINLFQQFNPNALLVDANIDSVVLKAVKDGPVHVMVFIHYE